MDLTVFIRQLVNGIQVGSIYALVALGYTMVYGIVKLINFAHGDFIMVGGYVAVFTIPFLAQHGMPTWLCIFAAVAVCCPRMDKPPSSWGSAPTAPSPSPSPLARASRQWRR